MYKIKSFLLKNDEVVIELVGEFVHSEITLNFKDYSLHQLNAEKWVFIKNEQTEPMFSFIYDKEFHEIVVNKKDSIRIKKTGEPAHVIIKNVNEEKAKNED